MLRPSLTALTLAAALTMTLPPQAAAELLEPFKDELFAYPDRLAEADGGRHLTIDYQEMRDINGRDEIPERRVKAQYIDLGVRRRQAESQGAVAEAFAKVFDGHLHGATFARPTPDVWTDFAPRGVVSPPGFCRNQRTCVQAPTHSRNEPSSLRMGVARITHGR